MSKLSMAVLLLALAIVIISGCYTSELSSQSSNTTSSAGQGVFSSPNPTENRSNQEASGAITIRSITFYGWWWSDDQMANNFDADNPPPKSSYIKLDRWAASQPDSPHPDRIDVTCSIENRTNQTVKLSLVAVADFKVASYRFMTHGPNSDKSIDESLKDIPWKENRSLGEIALGELAPGEVREIKFKDFSVRSVIDKYLRPAAGDLWPWKLRISIVARTSKSEQVGHSEAMIDLIPAD